MSPSPLQWTKERLDHEQPHIVLAEKTRWFKSPLVKDPMRRPSSAVPPDELDKDWDDPTGAHGELDGYPPFQRYEEPTLLEILYDLFFAANYNVFAQNQSVTNHQRFKAYVGYFSLLWGTWFVVALYDVRYVTDSMFERLARAVQLGVLVGFTVVAPLFDPEAQNKSTMMTMSLILCASRVCLAVEYANTLAHVFKYKRARNPLYLQIALNVIAAAVYLGVTFRFEKENSHVYITWYIFAAGEAILALVLSNFWRTLSFTRTHLMKRMSLITVMILGEGIQSVAQNIATIVKSPSAWSEFHVNIANVDEIALTLSSSFRPLHCGRHHVCDSHHLLCLSRLLRLDAAVPAPSDASADLDGSALSFPSIPRLVHAGFHTADPLGQGRQRISPSCRRLASRYQQ